MPIPRTIAPSREQHLAPFLPSQPPRYPSAASPWLSHAGQRGLTRRKGPSPLFSPHLPCQSPLARVSPERRSSPIPIPPGEQRLPAKGRCGLKSGRAMTQPSAGPLLAYPGHLLALGQALVYRGAVVDLHFYDAAIGPLRVPVRHGPVSSSPEWLAGLSSQTLKSRTDSPEPEAPG